MNAPYDFSPALGAVFQAVLQASWQGSLAVALVLLARRAFGARVPARWPYLLWFLVLARLLVPTFALPRSPASLENFRAVAHPFERRVPAPPPRPVPVVNVLSAPMSIQGNLPVLAPGAVGGAAGPRSPQSWRALAAWVWLAGALGFVGWLAACVIGLRRRLRREAVALDGDVLAIWQSCCRRWLRRTPPRLLAAGWVDSPALVGWLRPALLVPSRSLDSFTARDWEHVFAHEIAHLRWRDHWSQLLLLAAGCVHWFNPVVWIGLRRLRTDRELAADEWVLRHLENDGSEARSLAYGETLFKALAGRPARLSFQPGMSIGLSEDGAQMKQRLRRIAAFLPGRRLRGSLAGLAVVLLVGTAVLGQGSSEPAATPAASPTAAPAVPSFSSLAADAQNLSDGFLAAARAGDSKKIYNLIVGSFAPRAARFSQDAATNMLNDLVRNRELAAFTTLRDQFAQTNYGKDWKINDELLASLVKDGHTDFLDALLARGLDLERLSRLAKTADPATGEWITRRTGEIAKQRADVEALGKAASDGDMPAIQRLLDGGTDVNSVGKDDNTPLLRAVFKDRLDVAQFLLDHGAQVDKPRFPGWDYTPLCLAESAPMAELLKKNGANIHAKLWKRDVNILVYTAQFGKTEVVAWFLKQGLDPKMVGDHNENLLFGVGNAQTAKLLLDAGVDPNQVSEFKNTPICTARNAEIAQMLIDHGAKVTGFVEPLLPRMIQFGSGGAVEAALKAGAGRDPVLLQKALISAAHMDKSDIAQTLLKYGAKPNEPGGWGTDPSNTMLPLEVCCVFGSEKTAKVLLDAGADVNNPKAPRSFLKNALDNGYVELAEILRQAGAKGTSDLSFAIAKHDADKVKALLASAPAYAENPAFWEDVLPDAARVGDVDTVRAALAKGVPPVTDDNAYDTAAFEGQHEALALLLAARKPGDDPETLRHALWSAVWNSHPYPKQRTAEHFEQCVQMLLDAGAPVKGAKSDNLVGTAVFTRYPGGSPAVVEMLVRAGADPNPPLATETNSEAHLLDTVLESCAKGYCAMPVAETIIKLNHLAPARPDVRATPAPTPTPAPAPPDHAAKAEQRIPTDGGADSKGTVSMADGSPLGSEPILARVFWASRQGGSGVATEHVENGSFPIRLYETTASATVAVERKDCAVAYAGPFEAGNLHQLDGLQIKLSPGYTAAVQVVDETGQPIAGALLHGYYPGPPAVDLAEAVTDPSGSARIEHIGEAPLNLRVRAEGFQADEAASVRLDPAQPYRWTLRRSQPLRGTVTDSAGKPIPGAAIKLAGVRGPHDESYYNPKTASLLSTADAQGRFTLGSLRPDSRYYLFVDAPGYGGAYLRGVKSSPDELNVTLGPELLIRGKLIHIPPSVVHMGKVYLQHGQSFNIGENVSGQYTNTLALQPINGEAEFTVGTFYKVYGEVAADPKKVQPWDKKRIGIYVDGWAAADFSVDDLPVSDFVFDLAKKSDARNPED